MASHPYYPLDAVLPDFQPNVTSSATLMGLFGLICVSIILLTYAAAVTTTSQGQTTTLRGVDIFAASWFALCAFLHICFEGYFVYFQDQILSQQTLFAMLWKEYALSDSRYLTGDVFTLCVETMTVLAWGPLCLLTLIAILVRSPTRHVLQLVVSVAHLYGLALYFATNSAHYRASGLSHCRPEFLYYWLYYVGFNLPWLLVPLFLLHDSSSQITSAIIFQRDAERADKKE